MREESSRMAENHEMLRERMVAAQIEARGINDRAVLAAMRSVPRHLFVPEPERDHAYDDGPVAIGFGQTISQPFIVALMAQLAGLDSRSRVLEIGTGCGYQTAVLAASAGEVASIEIEPELSVRAAATLAALGITNIKLRTGDGTAGWPEEAPFDAIVVSAAPPEVPPALTEQLAPGGRLVIPVGTTTQQLLLITAEPGGLRRDVVAPVRFVPLR
jgi:protein-L-isoaspartate(D-aspartate) O-methyltransferase